MVFVYDMVWFWKSRLPERKGQRCRVLARGKMNSIAVEFEDGFRTITSRYAVRKANNDKPTIDKPWSDPDADFIGDIKRFAEYERKKRK